MLGARPEGQLAVGELVELPADGLAVAASQIRVVLSQMVVSRRVPSGLQAPPVTPVLSTLALRGAPPGGRLRDSRGISISDDGRCLVHVEGQAWLVRRTGDGLVSTRTMNFVAESYESWDADRRRRHRPHTTVCRATLDRSGRMVLTEATESVRVWDCDGTPRATLEAAKRPASAGVLSDGSIVTGTLGGRGEIWDGAGSSPGVFREEGDGLDLFIRAIHPRGEHFATTVSLSDTIEVRDSSGEVSVTLTGHKHRPWSAVFSPDGRLLVSGGSDRTVRVWNWSEGSERLVLHGHCATVHEVAFHPDDPGMLLSADQHGAVRLWRLETSIIPPLPGSGEPIVGGLTRTASGTIVGAGAVTTQTWCPTGEPRVLEGCLQTLTQRPDGGSAFVLTVDDAGAYRFWELAADGVQRLRGVLTPLAAGWDRTPESATISPDGRYLILVKGS